MKSIVFTTDVFRTDVYNLPTNSTIGAERNRLWLRGLFYDLFNTEELRQSEFSNISEGGSFSGNEYNKLLGLPKTIDGWASATATRIPDEAKFLFQDLINANVVIGWGLTPAMIDLLEREGVPFIDIEIDPIRFANDLFFRMRTNNEKLADLFKLLHVNETDLDLSVSNIRGYILRRYPDAAQTKISFSLFVGQMSSDLSIISNGIISKITTYIPEIKRIASEVDFLLVKPHPHETDISHISQIINDISNAVLCRDNIYRILADVNLQHVVALSSSVLHEAALFGIPTTQLISCDREDSPLVPPVAKQWYRIPPQILSEKSLLSLVLYGTPATRTETSFYSSRNWQEPFSLRKNFGGAWGMDDFYSNTPSELNLSCLPQAAHCRQTIHVDGLAPYLKAGWSHMENWGCWSVGWQHTLRFHLSDFDHWENVTATLHVIGFFSSGHPQQCIKIYVNGQLETERLLCQGDASPQQVLLPVFSPNVEIVIETPDAISPAELGISEDMRELGIGIVSISFSPGAAKEARP